MDKPESTSTTANLVEGAIDLGAVDFSFSDEAAPLDATMVDSSTEPESTSAEVQGANPAVTASFASSTDNAADTSFAARLRTEQFIDTLKGIEDLHQHLGKAQDVFQGSIRDADFLRLNRLYNAELASLRSEFHCGIEASSGLHGMPVEVSEALLAAADRIGYSYNHMKEDSAVAAPYGSDLQSLFTDCYQKIIGGMSPDFIEEVSGRIVGYAGINASVIDLAEKAKTYNELLHLYHSYLTRNEQIFDGLSSWALDVVERKESLYELSGEIKGIGIATDLAQQTYSALCNEMETLVAGWVTVTGTEQSTLVMVRDYGHATVFELKELSEGGPILVQYRIPKSFGVDGVQHLEGRSSYSEKYDSSSGQFVIESKAALSTLVSFLREIPTDTNADEIIRNNRATRDASDDRMVVNESYSLSA